MERVDQAGATNPGTPARVSREAGDAPQYDVIGAGTAGLSAAKDIVADSKKER